MALVAWLAFGAGIAVGVGACVLTLGWYIIKSLRR